MHPEIGKSTNGDALHYSVGAIIKRHEKFLLIDRAIEPFGFAVLAGHIFENETPEAAIKRVVAEESGLLVADCRLVFEIETPSNKCFRGIIAHYWRIFECETTGDPKLVFLNAKSIGWYTVEEMKKLKFDPAVAMWLKKMRVF